MRAILGRYVSRSSSNGALMPHYGVLIEAITESAAVTWVGLLFYEIATTAPTHGKITVSNLAVPSRNVTLIEIAG